MGLLGSPPGANMYGGGGGGRDQGGLMPMPQGGVGGGVSHQHQGGGGGGGIPSLLNMNQRPASTYIYTRNSVNIRARV